MKRRNSQTLAALAGLLLAGHVFGAADEDSRWAAQKRAALERPRRVLYNTDGCDAVYFPKELPATPENFIAQRLKFALKSEVDTILYCPSASGFGLLTSRTVAGDQLLAGNPRSPKTRNVTGELLAQGTDPLRLAEEFCRANNFEFFVSLRVNDTHDMSHTPQTPFFLFPPFKAKHPEYLMGSFENPPPYAAWSAVDFTHPAVRERFLAIVRELLTDYAVDGIELDFCRHLQYFKSVAWGAEASPRELEMMTQCMREIRQMAETIGRARNRPILVAIRVPDSAAYSRAAGLDVERWMQEKLLDILIGGFYFRLNSWEESVRLAHRYGVRFYPSMDESRIAVANREFARNTVAGDFARLSEAFHAGVDGIYYFNKEYHTLKSFRRSFDRIRFDAKRYFITDRDRAPTTYLATGDRYDRRKNLTPAYPVALGAGERAIYELHFGDDLQATASRRPQLTAYSLLASPAEAQNLRLTLNGTPLKPGGTTGCVARFDVPPTAMRPGANQVGFTNVASPTTVPAGTYRTILTGDRLLTGAAQPPWRRIYRHADRARAETLVAGAYRLADSGSGKATRTNLLYPLPALPGKALDVEFRMKPESPAAPLGAMIRLADGKFVEIVTFEANQVGLHFSGKKAAFDAGMRFHDYRVVLQDGVITVQGDGRELLREKLTVAADDPRAQLPNASYQVPRMHTQSLLIGSLADTGTGASQWQRLRLFHDGDRLTVRDFKLELRYPKAIDFPSSRADAVRWQHHCAPINGSARVAGKEQLDYTKGGQE